MSWVRKYLCIPYKDMNCSKFVEHVQRDHFGRDFNFPQSEGSIFNQSIQIRDNIPLYCEKTESPVDGDLVLMHGIRRTCHVGVYVKSHGIEYVLHCEKSRASSTLSRIKSLMLHGYSVEGFYKWVE